MTRLFDLIRGLIGLALIIVLLAGIPILLVVIVGYPLPTELPTTDVIRAHIEDGDIPDAFLIKTLALVIWFVWAQLAVATLVEMVAVARGRMSGRAPVLPGVQLVAGKLVASTLLIISAFAPSRSLAAAPIVTPEVAEASVETTWAAPPFAADGAVSSTFVDADRGQSVGQREGYGKAAAAGFYTTRSGDNWWDVAERLLGDGMRWSELRSLNSGRTMLTGEVVDNRTESVRAGWQLSVPVDADPAQLDQPDQPDADQAQLDQAGTDALGIGQPAADQPSAEAADASGETADGSGDGWSLVAALRPDSLVYEGPTGAERVGAGPAYQVVEGDNLWDIAERHLGDPFRWPEIYEASNDLTQTFGRRITDPNLIWPDSILVLPSDAVEVPAADPDLVAEVLGRSADAAPIEAAPDAAAPADDGPTAQELHEMAEDAARAERAADEAAAEPGAPDRPPVVAEPVQAAAPDGPAPDWPDPGDQQPEGVPAGALAVAAGGALMATGLLGLLARARRLRLSETGEASVPAPPPIDLVDIETVLRNRADSAAVDALADAIASLAAGSRRSDEPVPVPEVVRVAGSRIEAIVGDSTAPIPAPWRPVDVAGSTLPPNRRAVVAEAGDLGAAGSGTGTRNDAATTGGDARPSAGLAPTLVNVGDGLLINLEAIGVVELRGRSDSASALARSIVHELGSASLALGAPPVDVIVSEALADAGLGIGLRSSSPEQMLAELEPWLEETELALAASGADGPWGLRLAGGTAGASPARSTVVVVEGTELAADGPLAGLVDRANDRRLPLAVLVVGPVPAGGGSPSMTILADQEQVRLEPLGMAAVALDLDLDLVLGVEALIDHARRAPIVPRPELTWAEAEFDPDPEADRPTGALSSAVTDPAQAPTEETPEHDIATERPSDDEGEEVTDRSDDRESGLLIRVLGPVEVEGGPSDLSEREVAILAFLALAGPSRTDQIVDAIAPGRPDERAGVEADLVGLNARLGPLFPQAGDGRHRVRSTITDLGSARRWVAQASALSEERARNLLQLALSEVRGRPFDGIDRRSWQWIEDHRLAIATQATSLLMDACFDLCDSAYEADDLHLSLWACTVGSLIDPLQETAVTRQVQLLAIMGRPDEAVAVVDRWEQAFARAAGRPAPQGPRLALGQPLGAAESAARPPDGPGPSPADQEVATHVG